MVRKIFYNDCGKLKNGCSWLIIFSVWILVSALISVVILGIPYFRESQYCNTFSAIDEAHNYVLNFWHGCMLQLDNGLWVNHNDIVPGVNEIELRVIE